MEVLTVGVGGIAFTAQADLQSRWHMAAGSDPGSLGQCFVLQSTLCFSPAVWFPVPDWNLPALVSLSSVSTPQFAILLRSSISSHGMAQ